jgi:hypothetical protein
MANATLPRDTVGAFIQALAPAASVSTAVTAATARVAIPANCDCVRIAANTDCYFKFGTSTVTAANTDPIFLKGVEVFKIPAGATHVAFLETAADGTASVTAMV